MPLSTAETKHIFYFLPNNYAVILLAFIGGFIDAAGYIQLSGLFTSSITGNLVVACIGIDRTPQESLTRFLVSISFFLAACVTTFIAIRLKYTPNTTQYMRGICTFGTEFFYLSLTMVLGLVFEANGYNIRSLDLSSWTVILLGCTLGAAMGAHNAAAQEVIENCPSTTVMTMTLVKNAMHLARTISYFLATKTIVSMQSAKEESMSNVETELYMKEQCHLHLGRLMTAIRPLFSFLLGAVIGAFFMENANFWSLTLPMFIVTILMLDINYARIISEQSASNPANQLSNDYTDSPIIENSSGNDEKQQELSKMI